MKNQYWTSVFSIGAFAHRQVIFEK